MKCRLELNPKERGEYSMLRRGKPWFAGAMTGLILLMATPAFARSITLKDAGIALWIFIIIGAVIVLLQLIAAIILFFSFIGTSSTAVFKREKGAEEAAAEGKGILTGVEPAPVKK
jgi:hypothetical protein